MLRPCLVMITLSLCALSSLAQASEHKVLVLLADGFNRQEHYGTVGPLLAAGYQVVIATVDGQTARVRLDGQEDPQGRDVPADRSLADVGDPDDFVSLFIPGGYSPGFLENEPAAVAIATAFMEAGKPVSAICHGPRLLLRADRLHDRAWAGLRTIADELPDAWISLRRGAYIDQEVVIDRNLITARYPNDTPAFARATIRHLAAVSGGPALPPPGSALIITPHWSGHDRWLMESSLRSLGHRVSVVSEADRFPSDASFALTLILPSAQELGEEWEAVRAQLGRDDLSADAAVADFPNALAALPAVGAAVAAVGQHPAGEAAPSRALATAALALREGFDDAVAAAMLMQLRALGHEVIIIGSQAGWLRGTNGLPLEVTASYGDERLALSDNALIIAPGGFHPALRDNARQGEDADWLPEQAARDEQRLSWLRSRYEAGATILTVGTDGWFFARDYDALERPRISGSAQLRWSYPRGGASHTDDPVTRSAERLITVRSFADLHLALPQLEAVAD